MLSLSIRSLFIGGVSLMIVCALTRTISSLPLVAKKTSTAVARRIGGSRRAAGVHRRVRALSSVRLFSSMVSENQQRRDSMSRSGSCVMRDLKEVDSLQVTVIVDNECDTMSPTGLSPDIGGFQYKAQSKNDAGADGMCLAGHGLSLLLTTTTTSSTSSSSSVDNTPQQHSVLLDAGPTPKLWTENAQKLNLDLSRIEAAVLSHYHYDHSCGFRGAVPAIVETKKGTTKNGDNGDNGGGGGGGDYDPLVVDLHPSSIVSRGRVVVGDDEGDVVVPHKPDNPSVEELERLGARVRLHGEEHSLADNSVYVSGFIPRNSNDYERGMPSHMTLARDGSWKPDGDIADERYLACKVKNRGLVVFSACSHAGINNVCRDAVRRAAGNDDGDPEGAAAVPLFGVVGGLHLAGAGVQDRIPRTVSDLKELNPSVVLAGHCTGWKAKAELAAACPGRFQPLAVGATYVFHA